MKKKVVLLSCLICLSVSGCADESVSLEEYNSIVAEKEALEEELASAKKAHDNLLKKYNQLLESNTETETETTNDNSAYEDFVAKKEAEKNLPSDSEVIAYVQTVLKDYYPKCKFPFDTRDFTVINTSLRYKVEGEIHRTKESVLEEFVIIIEFEDETYENYYLSYLQIGDDIIYE